jgi:hypothetical protein
MARFGRCQLPAVLESEVALLAGATSPPFYGGEQRPLSPRVPLLRYTHRRIVDTALLSEALFPPRSAPNKSGLRGFPNSSFKVLALRALESV